MASDKKDILTAYFKIVMDDYDETVFQSCEGLQGEIEVQYVAEGGATQPRAVRGMPKLNKILFSKGNAAGKGSKKSLTDWFMEVADYSKPLKRQTLTIQLLDAQKNSVRTWRVLDAWPCRWLGPSLSKDSSDLIVEYIEFAHEGITG